MMLVCSLSHPADAAVGGGYAACGLKGEYFPNSKLDGEAAFVRQDNRLNFDWGANLPVGGSEHSVLPLLPARQFLGPVDGQRGAALP